jgi:hypothetical protein
MSGPQTHAPTRRPAGLLDSLEAGELKPWALLKRLRPIQLTALTRQLRSYERLTLGLKRLKQYFPEAFTDYTDLSTTGWWQVLAHLVNLVEQERWFEVNWPALNQAWAAWIQEPQEGGDQLAVYLHYLPVTLYGFTDGETIFHYPAIELMHALLSDCEVQTVSSQLQLESEIYDLLDTGWGDNDRQAAWSLLHQIEADPGRYPEPVRWLPELARWACHRTGNIMLDRPFDPHRDGPWLTWVHDLEQVKHAWHRTQPLRRALERLVAWCELDSTHIAKLAHFLIEGDSIDELTW